MSLKIYFKPFCNGAFGADIKKCRVKVEYQNQQGKVELMLGPEWSVALHEGFNFLGLLHHSKMTTLKYFIISKLFMA